MNTYSNKISPEQAEKIKEQLAGAAFDVIDYSLWRAKTSSFQVTYYKSGKILVQGKDISDICGKIDKIVGIENYNAKKYNEIKINSEKYIGTDESGKGDFFGPLVIAGVQINETIKKQYIDLGVKDSKKIDDKKILKLADVIKNSSVNSVIVINPLKYNELYLKFNNLNKLLAWGHARAIENILEKSPCRYALADKFGDENLIKNALMQKGRTINLEQRVRAEEDIAVAAASVLARAEFIKRIKYLEDKYMISFSKGASQKVIEEGNLFIKKYSYTELKEVAKMHFKTVNELEK